MKVLISGACGFVGGYLARYLIESHEGITIVGLDNLARSGSETNRVSLKRLGVQLFHGDIRMASDLETLPLTDWVIDAAAQPSVLPADAADREQAMAWFDAEAPQALTELVGGEGQPGVEPWEQPRRGRWRADATVGTAGADETVEELVEGRGDFERCRPEVQARYVGSGFHLVAG